MDLGVHVVPSGRIRCNSIVVFDRDTGAAAWIDPSDDSARMLAWLRAQRLTVRSLLLTHGHPDHVGDVAAAARAAGVLPRLHPADLPLYREFAPGAPATEGVAHGQRIDVGGSFTLEVLEVPGHSPGSVAFHLAGAGWVFCGDTLFYGAVGRVDLRGGDQEALTRSLRHVLSALPDATTVYPGHGPTTTIGHEKQHNPFLRWG